MLFSRNGIRIMVGMNKVFWKYFAPLFVVWGAIVVPKSFGATSYLGPTGILYELATAPNTFADIKVTCPVSGPDINSNKDFSALGGAHSCTSSETFFMQYNMSANGNGNSAPLDYGTYCIFLNGGDSTNCAYGYFSYSLGSISSDLSLSTRFLSLSPSNASNHATSTALTLASTGYLSDDDLGSSGNFVQFTLKKVTCGSNEVCLFKPRVNLSSSGVFSVSTSTPPLSSGLYLLSVALYPSGFWNLFSTPDAVFPTSQTGVCGSNGGCFHYVYIGTPDSDSEVGLGDASYLDQVFTQIPYDDLIATSSQPVPLDRAWSLRNLLVSKFPFNWVVEYGTVLNNLASSTATTTIPTVEVDYSGLSLVQNIATSTPLDLNFVFFSGATIQQVSQLSGIQAFRTFVSWTLWLSLITYAWRKASMMFNE